MRNPILFVLLAIPFRHSLPCEGLEIPVCGTELAGDVQMIAFREQPDDEVQPEPDDPRPRGGGKERKDDFPVLPDAQFNEQGRAPLGPTIFVDTTVGVIFFAVGLFGWVALGVAVWILDRGQLRTPGDRVP